MWVPETVPSRLSKSRERENQHRIIIRSFVVRQLSLSYHPSRACCAPCLPRNVPIEFLTRFVCHSKKPIQLGVVRFSISHVVVPDGLIRMMLSVPSSRVAARLLWYAARIIRLREENARRSDTVFHPTHLCRSGLVRPRIDHGRTLRRC